MAPWNHNPALVMSHEISKCPASVKKGCNLYISSFCDILKKLGCGSFASQKMCTGMRNPCTGYTAPLRTEKLGLCFGSGLT